MYNKIVTLTEYLLKEEQKFEKATGSFTLLMTTLENAVKIIASHVKQSGLVDILGKTGSTNASGDEVKKLDILSNEILVDCLSQSGQAQTLASEELADAISLENNGHYMVYFDPLDGSSNIEVNVNIGTIFSIYLNDKNILQPGRKQVAAGYIIYGPSVMFVYSCGQGVNGFTLDPSVGTFLLSHPNIIIPEEKGIYSFNESYEPIFHKHTLKYLKDVKNSEKKYTSRYIGSMVVDVHRTLLKGGIFGYPSDKERPDGILRLMYEVNPLAYIIQQAGGLAFSEKKNPLDITPKQLHQRVSIVMGSKKEVNHYQSFLS
ncbi:fructose-bisphosphatase [Candidatus Roizmanbacteria bacterium RIFCSPLOWO2_02_FULL_37_19]|uniref:Fructose-1,6-bisphosphatase class 1 n=1 Tax=Candidatus Roizmanbacteria bacterium RIFCSPHIGHO2_02_FULL_37_24 TaxID=1802037 RepID=A0A1F7GX20_9BACT|nr:MAG: fructose-bisphosphatase [Candidatus Roizmanbacteria bacterium RIFCSPHIGHO2_01_FULL_38_41]OGK23508.1 MAG: fructose-bisphosphatase [Candidatus Roizmanbacteria bacterium RIFCSPHIGHO2_02_FULL_37_24]OGK33466.1 MAG: fructose-bisphosphatase [Candidatus Roizmanbacteria bacterium RIFCSPHIGHO2_12_FULL_37_23]OGK45385.1 MAG: fructose-bisphosphatase [Candidatus Roizmanbacteria bacterium RIFCSPLOWO2_01_FULL_37_57]OGK54044.1 MAG: fructose-bisphosphatase [Candidatus Roizmanbacteria bacterium RIFCSPLOWO